MYVTKGFSSLYNEHLNNSVQFIHIFQWFPFAESSFCHEDVWYRIEMQKLFS